MSVSSANISINIKMIIKTKFIFYTLLLIYSLIMPNIYLQTEMHPKIKSGIFCFVCSVMSSFRTFCVRERSNLFQLLKTIQTEVKGQELVLQAEFFLISLFIRIYYVHMELYYYIDERYESQKLLIDLHIAT